MFGFAIALASLAYGFGAAGAGAAIMRSYMLRHNGGSVTFDTCPHVWGLWEDAELINGYERIGQSITSEGIVGARSVPRMVPGQKRECTMCGKRETRRVVSI